MGTRHPWRDAERSGGKWLRWWLSSVSVAILALSLGFSAASPAQAASEEFVQPGSLPATDGTTVVWVNHGVYAAHLADGQPFPVELDTPSVTHEYPDVAGDLVVWQQDCCGVAIRAKNVTTGQSFDVAPHGYQPRISGTKVLYQSGFSLQVRDLATMAPATAVASVPAGWGISSLRIAGNWVAWAEIQGSSNWRIMAERLGQPARQVASGSTMGFFGIDLAGDELVYLENGTSLAATNLTTGITTHIPARPYDQMPTTDGRYVFWERVAGNASERIDIVGYDLQTDSSFGVIEDQGVNVAPEARGGALSWTHGTLPNRQVHATAVGNALPSAGRPNSGTTSPDWIYFPETSHYLAFGFKDFWVESGGLPVFGYPLTEEFSELNPDLGKMLTVQYLERQRFEYHPELKGTPYETELGRLGAEDAVSRNLTSTAPFQALPATTGSDTNCTFFEETGHRVCFGFLSYWQSHGLDLGDPGISYRESLALFGYPISEEFVDPQSGLAMQYFERAVFEYRPANPDPYKVELRRLGADVLAARGWVLEGR